MEFNPSSLAVWAVAILAIFSTGEVVGVTCPENYINIHEKCLMFVLEKKQWESANVHCNSMGGGGELATHLDDCPLYEDLMWYIESHGDLLRSDFWVGGTDQDLEGVWTWTNGDRISMSAVYWGESGGVRQPNGGQVENCGYMHYANRHRFDDLSCKNVASFICQAEPIVKH